MRTTVFFFVGFPCGSHSAHRAHLLRPEICEPVLLVLGPFLFRLVCKQPSTERVVSRHKFQSAFALLARGSWLGCQRSRLLLIIVSFSCIFVCWTCSCVVRVFNAIPPCTCGVYTSNCRCRICLYRNLQEEFSRFSTHPPPRFKLLGKGSNILMQKQAMRSCTIATRRCPLPYPLLGCHFFCQGFFMSG